jgi:signal transduction histidine kinase
MPEPNYPPTTDLDLFINELISGNVARQVEAKSKLAQANLQEAINQLHALLDEVETEPLDAVEIIAATSI